MTRYLLSIMVALLAAMRLLSAPLVHLPFDRDTLDVSGQGHHAQAHNGAAVNSLSFRLGGGAAVLDGKSAFFNLPAFTPVEGNAARSISLWARSEQELRSKVNVVFCSWGDISTEPGVRAELPKPATLDRGNGLKPQQMPYKTRVPVASRLPKFNQPERASMG